VLSLVHESDRCAGLKEITTCLARHPVAREIVLVQSIVSNQAANSH
jgi:hypothetical protein